MMSPCVSSVSVIRSVRRDVIGMSGIRSALTWTESNTITLDRTSTITSSGVVSFTSTAISRGL